MNISVPIQILIPSAVISIEETYVRGILNISPIDHSITIYFTKFIADINIIPLREFSHENYIYAYYNKTQVNKAHPKTCLFPNYLELDRNLNKGITKLVIDDNLIKTPNANIVIIYYDYNDVKNSESFTVSSTYLDTFSKLHRIIENEMDSGSTRSQPIFSQVISKPSWLSSTMFGQHILNYINLINWITSCIKRDKKISIKLGNILLAVIIDVILGYLLLQMLSNDKKHLSAHLMGLLEKLVNYLYSLLKWLMGSPAGLKLNNAFNKMLGKYFSYHIQLWWLFLDVSGEKLEVILHIYHYVGYLGFTFQAAIISDMICIATFHSYCIYVYAARLFNIQIAGLIALIRLFVGRKYNPLRGGIDSCEYTNQEMFVGTVAFTILLFLLPTTAMYYIVFTLFRLVSLAMQYFLAKIIYWVQTLPLYVTFLWLIKSPKVAGNVSIKVQQNVETLPLVLKMNINSKSLGHLLSSTRPPVEAQNPVNWTNLLSKLLTGKQIT